MDNKEFYHQIDDYLTGKLTEQEKLAFEDALKTDSALASELALNKSLHKTFSNVELNKFRDTVKEVIEEERNTPKTIRRKIGWTRWAVAAAILVILSIGIWNWVGSGIDTNQLYTTHMDAYPVFTSTRSSAEVVATVEEARELYESESYDLALATLNSLPEAAQATANIQFLKGVTLIQMQAHQKALEAFSMVLDSSDENGPYVDQAQWYSALLYLKLGDVEKSKEILGSLSGKGGKYGKNAGELLLNL